MTDAQTTGPASFRRMTLPLMILAALFVVVPFLFWHGTWFGSALTDDEIARYLDDHQKPRNTQHALSQISDRVLHGDAGVRRFYPRIVTLTENPVTEIRSTAAWVMGQDNSAAEFHAALLKLLADPQPIVRRNAALALVRFNDSTGHSEIVGMLRPYAIRASVEGTLGLRLVEEDSVDVGTLLARVTSSSGEVRELRSPLPGYVQAIRAKEGAHVVSGDEILTLVPSTDELWEALRALYVAGESEDLPAVEAYTRPQSVVADKVRQQALLTARQIKARAASSPAVPFQ